MNPAGEAVPPGSGGVLQEIQALLSQKQYDAALRRAEAALRRAPDHVRLLSYAASAAFALGQLSAAEQYLSHALRFQPDSSVLRENLEKVRKRMNG